MTPATRRRRRLRVKRMAAPAPASAPGAPTSTDAPEAVRLVPKVSPPRPSVERQGGRGGTAPVAGEVGGEGVGRAAIAGCSGRTDEEKVAVEREGRAETVGGGGVGGGEQGGRAPPVCGEAQDCAGACVRGRAEVDGVAE